MSEPTITRAAADAYVEPKGNRVTKEGIGAKIAQTQYWRPLVMTPEGPDKGTTTICVITMANGFTFDGKSGCVDPANFDAAVGERYAYDDAFRQIWAYEGYLLATRRHEGE